jgi:hypothetical protein
MWGRLVKTNLSAYKNKACSLTSWHTPFYQYIGPTYYKSPHVNYTDLCMTDFLDIL